MTHQLYTTQDLKELYYSMQKVLNAVADNLGSGYSYGVAFSYLCEYIKNHDIQLTNEHLNEITKHLYQTTNWNHFDEKENRMLSIHNKKLKK